ncbi:MAG: hypothetical protein IPL86_07525 [Flavobacteriales bacterium]|nr:hypothetical protein [Flavobacteriales bacterium]
MQAVIASGDGNILLCGSSIAPGRSDQDALVAKISNTGAVLWTWTSNDPLNEEELRGLERTADNGVIACGTFRGGPDSQALLVRISPSGTLQWNQQYGTGGDDALNGVALMDNGFMAAGRVANLSGDVDAYVLAVDLNGSELWWQSWGGIKPDLFNGIARSGANFYLAGRTGQFRPISRWTARAQHLPNGDGPSRRHAVDTHLRRCGSGKYHGRHSQSFQRRPGLGRPNRKRKPHRRHGDAREHLRHATVATLLPH